MRGVALVATLLLALGASAAPQAGDPVNDPWERWNREAFKFNLAVDRRVVRPVVRGYRDAVPQPVRDGVSRFFDNLENPVNMVNNLLQGKPARAGSDLARFAINTTLGLGGFLDPASTLGRTQSDEDFGQTLGRWGVGTGPYLVLPFLPPKTVRELLSEVPDQQLDPITYAEDEWVRYGGKTLDYLELRYRVLPLDDLIDEAYDPYVFVRNAYLDRRAYKVRDGAPLADDASGDELYDDPGESEVAPTETPPPSEPPPY